jgi:hypothetical protein
MRPWRWTACAVPVGPPERFCFEDPYTLADRPCLGEGTAGRSDTLRQLADAGCARDIWSNGRVASGQATCGRDGGV